MAYWTIELSKKIKKPTMKDMNAFMRVNLWLRNYYYKNGDILNTERMDIINDIMEQLPDPNPLSRRKK